MGEKTSHQNIANYLVEAQSEYPDETAIISAKSGQFKSRSFKQLHKEVTLCSTYFKSKGNRRGVGFDKPQLTGNHQSTCGCVSEKSFGHSGYTGTYAWADPDKEIIIVILANRTYPNDDKTFSKKNIRTRIQGYVYEALIN